MDFIPILFTVLTLTIIFLIRNKKKSSNSNLPRGSNGWPFIGETYEFLYGDPEKFIGDRMKKYSSKIFKTKVFGEPVAVLCNVAGNKFIATNEEKLFKSWRPHSSQRLFRSTNQTKTSVLPMDRKTEVQVIRTPGFIRPDALVRYVEGMDNMIQHHLKMHWEGNEIIKVYDQIELIMATLSSRFFLGLKDPHRIFTIAQLLHTISLGVNSMTINFPGTIFYRARKSANHMRTELLLLIKEKKTAISSGEQMNDMLTHMIFNKGQNGEFMPEREIADKVMGLLVAGFSSPANALTFVMKFIGERQEVYEKIQEEQVEISRQKSSKDQTLNWNDLQKMKYTWSICLEVMRLIPPLQGTFREALTDITYEGFTIPKGGKVYWTVSSTNKDPEYFPNPEEFVGSRFEQENFPPPYTNVPFGGGPRTCPGKEYTRMVMLVFLHNVVKLGFKWEVMYPNEKVIGSMTPIPAKGLPVRLMPSSMK